LKPQTVGALATERILGIDPGSIVTGWGLVEVTGNHLNHIAHGVIAAPAVQGQGERLCQIFHGIQEVLRRYSPSVISLEKVFFARNAQSALKLGQARGVALLAAAEQKIAVSEYAATEIKVAVVGYGHATKQQIQKMVTALLCLRGEIRADAADALAAALCHAHRQSFQSRLPQMGRGRAKILRWRDYLEHAARK
jgi:crossover junction endodeoxyribonuclease RuvC